MKSRSLTIVTKFEYLRYKKLPRLTCLVFFLITLLYGCSNIPVGQNLSSEKLQEKIFVLEKVTTEQAQAILTNIGLNTISNPSEPNTILVKGSPDELVKIATIINLIDANDQYVIKKLAPASSARDLPSNKQIAEAIGEITIGTFSRPPQPDTNARAIIDFYGDDVLAIAPEQFWSDVCEAVKTRAKITGPNKNISSQKIQSPTQELSADHSNEALILSAIASEDKSSQPATKPQRVQIFEPNTLSPSKSIKSDVNLPAIDESVILRGVLKPFIKVDESHKTNDTPPAVSLANGDDVIELSLPEKIELTQLVDLVGEYLHLDCTYDPEKIKDHIIMLKLHSRLRSEMRVKDLYSLLETILKSRGFVMTRQEGNLVMIVPTDEALNVDPEFIDPNAKTLQAGNMIVTCIFELKYVDVASVTNLLQNMKLSVAVSSIEETQTLFVTCYVHRMGRIEQLVSMIDRAGKPREFRFRQLKHTAAGIITPKILKLAEELQNIPIVIASEEKESSPAISLASQRTRSTERTQGTQSMTGQPVFLDTDERTNRILMIGYDEQLETVEGLIDILDIPQQVLQIPKVYGIEHIQAKEALRKLQEAGAIGRSNKSSNQSRKVISSASANSADIEIGDVLAGEPRVVVLETTNQLLINASREQHVRINEFLNYIDVLPEDSRTLEIYKINYVEAEDVTRKLRELGIIAAQSEQLSSITARTTENTATIMATSSTEDFWGGPRVIVIEPTNSLMVNATPEQHDRITTIIKYIDCKTEDIPYQFYPLENQSPEHLADVLRNLIYETVQDKEDKIVRPVTKENEIKIVPDPNTFSLIVYASKKNQEWIASLIEKLDKRRPQVLIDVALVEVSRTDEFDLDLQLATKWPKLKPGGQMSVVGSIVSPFVSETGEVFSSPKTGAAQGFYTDAHIQALLTAIQTKSYGRVLAKPKILVNDGQPGTIKTIDTTSVKIESIIIPEEGTQRTTTDFKEYEAGISLTITPNISEGDLLLLQVELDRTDFLQRPDTSVPPDTTASNINTIVTVPDGRTIILGGLLKLNQTKGGTKVPLLGDIPLLGGLFRSTSNTDNESRLYVFLKANILRPDETVAGLTELEKISEKNRTAFETFEEESQKYEGWPGIKSGPINPIKMLELD